MSKPKVLCVMPTRVSPDVRARAAMDVAGNTYGAPVTVQRGEPRDFNRNRCVQLFLEHERHFDYMLFVDDDTTIPPDTIARLLAVDKPIVSGVQPLWMHEILVANVKLPDGPNGEPAAWPDWISWARPAEPFRIGFCGFGCILIRRDVFEAIGYPWFVEKYGDVWGKGNMTEDIDFNIKANAAGIEQWCEPTVVCGHLKEVNLLEWLPRSQINLTVPRPLTVGE